MAKVVDVVTPGRAHGDSPTRRALRRFAGHRLAVAGSVVGLLLVLLAALALSATLGVVGQTPAVRIPRGIWPLARHDAQNTGRSDVPGRFAGPPVEVWRYGGLPPGYSFIKPVTVSGGEAFLPAPARSEHTQAPARSGP